MVELEAAHPKFVELCRAEKRRRGDEIRLISGEVRLLTRKFPAPGIG